MQVAGERQHESHDMDADVVGVDAARVGDDDVAGDQLGKIEARIGAGRRTRQPFQAAAGRQQLGIQGSECPLGIGEFGEGMAAVFADDGVRLGNNRPDSGGHAVLEVAGRRQDHEFEGHRRTFPVLSVN